MFVFFFFFSSRRRHTRSLCDWSSDVCSSDLRTLHGAGLAGRPSVVAVAPRDLDGASGRHDPRDRPCNRKDRKSVVQGKSVELGGRRIIKKKKNSRTNEKGRKAEKKVAEREKG